MNCFMNPKNNNVLLTITIVIFVGCIALSFLGVKS